MPGQPHGETEEQHLDGEESQSTGSDEEWGAEEGEDTGSETDAQAEEAASSSRVVCVTADYAMQNVILQMGLRLAAPDGMRITRTRRWALRCTACFQVSKVSVCTRPPRSQMWVVL